ncbi:hypothetical protein HK405_009923 [Cladochytrium tenue]|nr:hypothetical protein HK405_009923 [Cladochytrium tenue]
MHSELPDNTTPLGRAKASHAVVDLAATASESISSKLVRQAVRPAASFVVILAAVTFAVVTALVFSVGVSLRIGNGHGARDTVTVLWSTNDMNSYLVPYRKGRPRPELDLEVLHPNLRRMLDERPDWVVLNLGLWINPSSWAVPGRDFLQGFKLIIANEAESLDSDGYSCNSTEPSFNTSGIDYLYGYAEEAQNAVLSSLLRRENRALLQSAKEGQENAGARSRLVYRILDAESVGRARRDAHKDRPNDCSHYCLPGVPDHWNRLLLQMMWDDCIEGLVP